MSCTPSTAIFCPNCGECTCTKSPKGEPFLDVEDCPLHAVTTKHADTSELADMERKVDDLSAAQGMVLTANDRTIVARFMQRLNERHRAISPEAEELRKKLLCTSGGPGGN